jgi:hypothetical protein
LCKDRNVASSDIRDRNCGDDKHRARALIITLSDAISRPPRGLRRRGGFLKDASTSIAQRDQSIRMLRAHRPVKAAGDIEPIIARRI